MIKCIFCKKEALYLMHDNNGNRLSYCQVHVNDERSQWDGIQTPDSAWKIHNNRTDREKQCS